MKILFFIVLLYIFRRYLAFIVLCVPLRIVNQRSRVAFLAEKKDNSLNACCEKLPTPMNLALQKNENEHASGFSLARVLKKKIFCIIYGYSKYLIYTIKYFPSHVVRNWVYKYIFLVDCHPNSTIYFGCEIRAGYSLQSAEAVLSVIIAFWMHGKAFISVKMLTLVQRYTFGQRAMI